MFAGETILSGGPLPEGFEGFEVMRSAAGFYVGTSEEGEPYSRETVYTQDREEAEQWCGQLNAPLDGVSREDEEAFEEALMAHAFAVFVRQ